MVTGLRATINHVDTFEGDHGNRYDGDRCEGYHGDRFEVTTVTGVLHVLCNLLQA